jgi:hypothetical protein
MIEVVGRRNTKGRDNLKAPGWLLYIATVCYIFKLSQGNNEENGGAVPKWESVRLVEVWGLGGAGTRPLQKRKERGTPANSSIPLNE